MLHLSLFVNASRFKLEKAMELARPRASGQRAKVELWEQLRMLSHTGIASE